MGSPLPSSSTLSLPPPVECALPLLAEWALPLPLRTPLPLQSCIPVFSFCFLSYGQEDTKPLLLKAFSSATNCLNLCSCLLLPLHSICAHLVLVLCLPCVPCVRCALRPVCPPSPVAPSADFDLTGQIPWPAASHLASLLLRTPHLVAGRHVLELGSGLGVLSVLHCSLVPILTFIAFAANVRAMQESRPQCDLVQHAQSNTVQYSTVHSRTVAA